MKFCRSPVGRFIGSNTVNYASGGLIGLGAAFLLSGFGAPVGVPLIAVGAFLLVLNTGVSSAALEDRSALSVTRNIVRSLAIAGVGCALCTLFMPSILGSGSLGLMIGVGAYIGLAPGMLFDSKSLYQFCRERYEARWKAAVLRSNNPTPLKVDCNNPTPDQVD